MGAGAIVPAGEGRTIFVLPWLGQTLIGTTDTDHDGDADHVRPSEDEIAYLLDAVNAFFATSLDAGRPRRRLRGRAAADLDRRPAQVGRHLAQGRALRDLERDDHDHRRQAHDLAADGQADRRPDRRARRLRRARAARTRSRSGWRSRRRISCAAPEAAREQLAGRYGHLAHDVLRSPRAARAGRADRRPAAPTCWPRSPTPPGASRRARSATCCCAAPGSALTAARGCSRPARGAIERVAARDGGGARLGRGAPRARGSSLPRGGRAEGILPARNRLTFGAAVLGLRRLDPAEPLRPGVALPRRLIVLLIAASCSSRPRPRTPAGSRRRRSTARTPTWSSVGNVDLARDGAGAVAYLRSDGGVPHAFVARLSGGAWRRAGARRLRRPARRPRSRSRSATATGSRSPGSPDGNVYANVAPGGDTPGRSRAGRQIGGPGAASTRHRPRRQRRRLRGLGAGRQRRAPRACRTRRGRRVAAPLDVDPALEAGHRRAAPAGRGLGRGLRRRDLGRAARRTARTRVWARRITGLNLSARPAGPDARRRRPRRLAGHRHRGRRLVRLGRVPAGPRRRLAHGRAAAGRLAVRGARGRSTAASRPTSRAVDMSGARASATRSRRPPAARRSSARWLDHDHFQPAGGSTAATASRRPSRRSPRTDRDDIAIAWRDGRRRQRGRARPLQGRRRARSAPRVHGLAPGARPGRRPRRVRSAATASATSRSRWSRARRARATLTVGGLRPPAGRAVHRVLGDLQAQDAARAALAAGPRPVGRADLPRASWTAC